MSGELYTDEMKFYYFTSSEATQTFCTADGITDHHGWRRAATESEKGKKKGRRTEKWSDSAGAGPRDEIVYLGG